MTQLALLLVPILPPHILTVELTQSVRELCTSSIELFQQHQPLMLPARLWN